MTHDFKPGDVAMAVKNGAEEHRAFFTDDLGWVCLNGIECNPDSVRRLVVIDPEDREQVERLESGVAAQMGWKGLDGTQRIDATQAALREFANPQEPKPEEPLGLGAVAEDAEGVRYVRHCMGDDQTTWCDPNGIGRPWSRVAAVRVLSEGVTP